jgi:sigma-E factor negative regulatory protein RseA
MMNEQHLREQISALVDGELSPQTSAAVLDALRQIDGARAVWREYQCISDALNERPTVSDDFLDRFAARLAAEPVLLAPKAAYRRHAVVPRRWMVVLSVAASAVLVSVVGWYGLHATVPDAASPAVMAAAPAIAPVVQDPVGPYLAAHQSLVGNPGLGRPVVLVGADTPVSHPRAADR